MKEIADICVCFANMEPAGKRSALATVVKVEGSSYRRPGARMLVCEDGTITGAISGGCLEGDARRKALLAIEQGNNKLVTYDTREDDAAELGIQLGCRGVVTILFEPLSRKNNYFPIPLLQKLISERKPGVLGIAFTQDAASDVHPGTCMLYRDEDVVFQKETDFKLAQWLEDAAKNAMHSRQSIFNAHSRRGERLTVFADYQPPPISLIIAGAGNDALPLLDIAKAQGWQVTVIDGRMTHANIKRFPAADKIHVVTAGLPMEQVECDAWTACILMSHNYNFDKAVLQTVRQTACFYIGILGPRKKLEEIYADLERCGEGVTHTQQAKIFGPAGLDIGAEASEEIALSIIAEIKAVASGRQGNFLRAKNAPIHFRKDE